MASRSFIHIRSIGFKVEDHWPSKEKPKTQIIQPCLKTTLRLLTETF